jgi:hypothetical protein
MVKFHIFLILTFDGRELSTYASILSQGRAHQYVLNTMLGGPQIRSEHDNGGGEKNPWWEASAHVAVHSQSHMTYVVAL